MMSPSFGMLAVNSSSHSRTRSRRSQREINRSHTESRNSNSDSSSSPGLERREMPQHPQPQISTTPKKSLCVANIFKYTKTEKIGLNLKLSNTMGRIYVSDIKRNSKFASTPLQIGMVVLTVNGKPCPRTVKETATLIKGIEGDLTLVACSLKDPSKSTSSSSSSNSLTLDPRRYRRNRREEDEARRQRLNESLAPVQ